MVSEEEIDKRSKEKYGNELAIFENTLGEDYMSWKFVFNSNNFSARTIQEVAVAAEKVGYDFFTFNGDVYFINNGTFFKTKIKSADLV